MSGYPFLAGGGELGQRIAAYDWSGTSIGPLHDWPASLRNTVALMLRSDVPMVLLWGEDGVMIYNDAYSEFAGGRDSSLLGSKVREGWDEVAEFNDNVMKVGLAGGTLKYDDHVLTLNRHGVPEEVWLNLDYSPVLDDRGVPAGVIAIVVEITETRRVRAALEAKEAQLRRSQEAGGVGLFAIDIVTNRISATPEFCRIFGVELREEIPAEEVERLIHPEDVFLVSNISRRRDGSAARDVEYRIRRADDGEERTIARKAEYERDAAGRPVRMVGAVQDITDRRRIKLALERSEAGFSALAQHMPNQVWTARPDGRFDWFNAKVYAYCGEPEGSLDGSGWWRMVHPDDLEPATGRWASAVSSGGTFETELRVRGAGGDYRWFLARGVPLRGSDGAIGSWVGTNTDIHEQKVLEVETIQERERLWSMSQDILLVCDLFGRITDINPSAQRLLGWSKEEMVGVPLTDFVHPDDLPSTAEEFPKLQAGVATLSFENRYRTKTGDYRLLDWTAVPDGSRIHGVGRDITQHRAIEEALRQSQKMEAVGQLTGGIAHDFNNLLQGITGSLDIMERRLAQGRTGELDRWLAGAKTSASRAAALTHRLLAFSRRQPLDPRPVRANPLISSMEDMLRRTLGERISLELALADGLWLTRCDPNQLESAILNLAINARDAMPEGGRLTIGTRNVRLDEMDLPRSREVRAGSYVRISVRDTGTGMDKATVDRAFEPFFTTKPIGQGTGLGLSMIYGFARQSEGDAAIESSIGEGTEVNLYLPRFADGDAAVEEDGERRGADVGGEGEVVLVVEDEPVVRGLIVDVLEELGYSTIEAGDGLKGWEILRSDRRIDLLVTDIGLPGLNGRQVADAGRTVRPGLKVLFMTGYAENAALAAGFLEPGMAMITKPFAMDVLSARIREIIESD